MGMSFFRPWMITRSTVSGEPSAEAKGEEPVRPSTVRLGIQRGIRRSNRTKLGAR